jgi:hypothetical protein
MAEERPSTRAQREYPPLEVVVSTEIPQPALLHTLEGVNEVLKAMDFPYIKEYMLEDPLALLDLVNNLSIEYAGYGLEISTELQELRGMQQKIMAYREREKRCDMLEIQLANLREECSRMEKYSKYDLAELRHKLAEARRMHSDMKTERENKELLDEILFFLSGGNASSAVLEHLGHLREEYGSVLEKALLVEEIAGMRSCPEKIVYTRLCSSSLVQLGTLEKELDRIRLLKIVYDLLSRKIIAFDRSEDAIYLLR